MAVALTGAAMPSPVRAEFTLRDQAGAWLFYTQRGVGQRYAACQVVSCVRGTCGNDANSRVQFSLYDARDGRGTWPEFIALERVQPGASARLEINGSSYRLTNTFASPQFYMMVSNPKDAQRVLADLRALEEKNGNGKFTVTDPSGREFIFTVRGVSESMSRMERRCTQVRSGS